MKQFHNFILLVTVILMAKLSPAQNVGINTDGSAPNPNAMLDVKSSTKGILIPRVSSSARLAIPNTKGLLVYDTTVSAFFFNTGTVWQSLKIAGQDSSGNNSGWLLRGNAGTDTSNFLGTTDNHPFILKVNNTASGLIEPASGNVLFGFNTGSIPQRGRANTATGSYSLASNTTGYSNTTAGYWSMFSNTTGAYNNAQGDAALQANTSGSFNSAVGASALYNNTTGGQNTAQGYRALYNNNTGYDNTAIGGGALFFNTASGNTAIGTNSLFYSTTGFNNTAIGRNSLVNNNTGSYNTCVGDSSLAGNTQGIFLNGFGFASLVNNTTGYDNTAIGDYSLYSNTTGNLNVAVGGAALYHIIAGRANTAVGWWAGASINGGNIQNSTALGANATFTQSNQVVIGDGSITSFECSAPLSTISDGRFKKDIKEDIQGLDFILHLRPVSYRFDAKKFDEHLHSKGSSIASLASKGVSDPALQRVHEESLANASSLVRSGFIAQEVEAAANASGFHFSGIKKPVDDQDHYSLSYETFVVPLVKAVQEQQAIIVAQDKKIKEQDRKLEAMQQFLEELKQRFPRQ